MEAAVAIPVLNVDDSIIETEETPSKEVLLDQMRGWLNSTLTEKVKDIHTKPSQQHRDKLMERLLRPLSYRPDVGIGRYDIIDEATNKKVITWIRSLDDLRQMINSLTDIKQTLPPNDKGIAVFYGTLPDSYVAQAPYIKFRHLPDWAKYAKTAYLVITDRQNPNAEPMRMAEGVKVFKSDRAFERISKEIIKDTYHKVSLRVNLDTLTLESWNPGLDIHVEKSLRKAEAAQTGEDVSELDSLVLVGYHYEKHYAEPQKKFHKPSAVIPSTKAKNLQKPFASDGVLDGLTITGQE